jgi:hypothetical protein
MSTASSPCGRAGLTPRPALLLARRASAPASSNGGSSPAAPRRVRAVITLWRREGRALRPADGRFFPGVLEAIADPLSLVPHLPETRTLAGPQSGFPTIGVRPFAYPPSTRAKSAFCRRVEASPVAGLERTSAVRAWTRRTTRVVKGGLSCPDAQRRCEQGGPTFHAQTQGVPRCEASRCGSPPIERIKKWVQQESTSGAF